MKSFIVILLATACTVAMVQAQQDEPAVPAKRAHHSLVYVDHLEKVLLTGGSTPQNDGNSFVFFDDVWTYDGRQWKSEGTTGNARSGISLAVDLKKKEVLSLGGFANNQILGELRVLNAKVWTTLTDLPEMKMAEGIIIYDPDRDRFIAFGGSASPDVAHATTWEWDRSTWRKIEGEGPPGRSAHAMVYDTKRKKIVLFGGSGKNPNRKLSDTWEFDGARWTSINIAGPSPRISPGYAYDAKRGLFVIYGGLSSTGMLGDTWGWDGTEWKKLADTGPAPRAMGYMAYDKKRERVVLFGGRLGWPNDVNDTWEWDGVRWKEVR